MNNKEEFSINEIVLFGGKRHVVLDIMGDLILVCTLRVFYEDPDSAIKFSNAERKSSIKKLNNLKSNSYD